MRLAFVAFGQIEQDLQRAIERLAGAEQRRQLLRELHDLRLAQRRALEQRRDQPAESPPSASRTSSGMLPASCSLPITSSCVPTSIWPSSVSPAGVTAL